MTPKDWNTQEEAIAAAKAEILAAIGDTDARLELGMVKSIQRGTAIKNTAQGSTIEINIHEVDVDKSIIFLQGEANTSGWYAPVRIDRFLPESFTVSCAQDSIRSYTMFFSWVVVEFY